MPSVSPIATMSLEDWHTVIDTNVNGLFYCTREAIPRMLGGLSLTILLWWLMLWWLYVQKIFLRV